MGLCIEEIMPDMKEKKCQTYSPFRNPEKKVLPLHVMNPELPSIKTAKYLH